MKPKPFLFLLIPIILLTSCNSLQPDFGLATDYFPSAKNLQEGIVNKYYSHQTSGDGEEVTTQIRYIAYQLSGSNELQVRMYNPAMELTGVSRYRFEGDKTKLMEQKAFIQGDSILSEIQQLDILDWAGQSAICAFRKENPGGRKTESRQEQLASRDSMLEGRKARIFYQKNHYKNLYKGDSAVFDLDFVRTYVQGVGLFGYEMTYDGGSTRMELVAQIPYPEFVEMARQVPKRIGYIDPRIVLDQESGFELCGRHEEVADYYNGQDKRAQYAGGKRAIWELVNKQLDKAQLFEESGYLSLRFIVNCKGEAGWFTMEEADLDFQPKHFPAETIQHFFEMLYQNPDWKPCIIREEARDAYTYITFKLKDGEIIDILP